MIASNNSVSRPALLAVLGLILLAIAGRFLPYLIPELGNFTPVAAVSLFAGCYLQSRRVALLVPLVAMLLSDAIIGFHSLMPLVYGCMALTAWFGMRLQNATTGGRVLRYALLSSVIFFVVTNAAVWLYGTLYPMTMAGLRDCFVAAIPFWRNELVGTLAYSAALFGGYALLKARYPRLAMA